MGFECQGFGLEGNFWPKNSFRPIYRDWKCIHILMGSSDMHLETHGKKAFRRCRQNFGVSVGYRGFGRLYLSAENYAYANAIIFIGRKAPHGLLSAH